MTRLVEPYCNSAACHTRTLPIFPPAIKFSSQKSWKLRSLTKAVFFLLLSHTQNRKSSGAKKALSNTGNLTQPNLRRRAYKLLLPPFVTEGAIFMDVGLEKAAYVNWRGSNKSEASRDGLDLGNWLI